MKKQLFYEAPQCQDIELLGQEVFCVSAEDADFLDGGNIEFE
jgi:hypothetical protein